ncbi:unnamed protein product [Protopolystoma xenopodis]|uniref:Uncharacterized protein n=1 Tax=Protopolystoma xenopodis TaxID=117903 RepID=A0A3S5B444_9PLAT|nr:unnamed protein product [Protopolystoma xenopodis]
MGIRSRRKLWMRGANNGAVYYWPSTLQSSSPTILALLPRGGESSRRPKHPRRTHTSLRPKNVFCEKTNRSTGLANSRQTSPSPPPPHSDRPHKLSSYHYRQHISAITVHTLMAAVLATQAFCTVNKRIRYFILMPNAASWVSTEIGAVPRRLLQPSSLPSPNESLSSLHSSGPSVQLHLCPPRLGYGPLLSQSLFGLNP